LLTAVCSVALAEAIEASAGLATKIKWPNDLMIGDRKVCGVLTEVVSHGGQTITVVGLGLNVNLALSAAGLPPTATALSAELGRSLDRRALLHEILLRIDRYLALDDGALRSIIWARWQTLLWRRMQAVRVQQDGPTLYGVIEGISSSGAIRLRTPDGDLTEVAVGDVTAI